MPRKTTLYAYYKDDGSYFRSFKDANEVKAYLHVEDISHISKSINGKRPTAFNYMWARYYTDNIITSKLRDERYVIVDVVKNKIVGKADNYIEIAKFFHCKVFQLKKGIATNDKGLFRQRFRFDKESKHRLPVSKV